MATRRLNDWLSGYIEYTKSTEPPLSYHTWIGIAMLASSLQRRVYHAWGSELIYPNMYIVLVGPAGRCRKGTALKLGKDILEKMPIHFTSECIIREQLIRKMVQSTDSFIDPDTKIVKYHSSMTIVSPELSVFLGKNNPKFMADLTDWYDSGNSWTYETKHQGTDSIQGLCFNILAATAPDWWVEILPEAAIGGGFTSRIIFVVEEEKGKTVAKPIYGQKEIILSKALTEDLERICTLAGEYEFAEDAEDYYISWYEVQDKEMRNGRFPIQDTRFYAYCDRRATHLRKLCMCLAASRSDNLIISVDTIDRALKILEATERKMPKAFGGFGSNKMAGVTEKILRLLVKKKQVSRSKILAEFYLSVDYHDLLLIQETLAKMGAIRVIEQPHTGDAVYEYTGP